MPKSADKRTYSLSKIWRTLALVSVVNPDSEYYTRRIFRWYSKEFHTPLNIVPDIPLEDVFQAYYESRYEDLIAQEEQGREQYLEELRDLTETDKEREDREMQDYVSKKSDEEYLRKIMEDEKSKKEKQATKTIEELGSRKEVIPSYKVRDKEVSLPVESVKPLPDIKISFGDESELERFEQMDLFGEPTYKKDK